MNYLTNYLTAIPGYDVTKVQQALSSNQLHFGLDSANRQEFERLVTQVTDDRKLLSEAPTLNDKLEAAPLNQFYSSVEVDLAHLFSEQAAIEMAATNYHYIYKDVLEELTRSANQLQQAVDQLDRQPLGERGMVLKEYSFEPEQEHRLSETYSDETAYLYVDRDGTPLTPPEVNRLYHHYSLTLSKRVDENALLNDEGLTTASLEILYQTPGTLTNHNPSYQPSKAIDHSSDTFWFNVALKASNGLDKIDISPKGWG